MPKHSIQPAQVAAFRLARHHFMDRVPSRVYLVCRDVCGVQAQVMSSAQMALWARIRNLKRSDVYDALWKKRTIVKTSAMRQTLHLLPASDFSIYIAALKASRLRAVHRLTAKFGITPKELEALDKAILKALRDGPVLQCKLRELVIAKGGPNVQKWASMVWSVFRSAIAQGLICYGPEQGQQVTLVRTDKWLPPQPSTSEAVAQSYLVRRYLRAYGPATANDFAHWSGLSVREAKAAWGNMQGDLVEVTYNAKKASLLKEDLNVLHECDLRDWIIRVLPGFDSFVLAHADKDHLVPPHYYKRVFRNQGWISPVILFDGKVVGTWSYKRGSKISFEVSLFKKFSKIILTKIEEQSADLARFLESEYEIKFVFAE